ncbi:4,5-dihydroxyphthalate decarboxylase [Pseudonocardia acaciae]|uniref:4,5-dihydroxyphthalate decarboxylase n=1 Tax=Pseudonocardia acaciae TaxID=551276 RepID=UPI00049200CE|nr:4,5-dihydroxyphthalate decarboxylase [Pseudonocardia acaciae]
MGDLALTVASYRYDSTRALFDRSVTFEGIDASFHTAPVISDIFERMVRGREFDVSELGLTFYTRTLDLEDPPFVAIPVFPNRVFRHSCIYVNRSSGITEPKDLEGRTVGEFGIYGQDSGVWAKGILADEYGFDPARCRWLIGGLDRPITPFDFVPRPAPDGLDVRYLPDDRALGPMLESGEIDALFSANVPRCVLDGSPEVVRLFPDYEPVERDYYRRTGIFPAMHAIVLRRDLLGERPGLARTLYDGFLAAKNAATEKYLTDRRIYQASSMIPWMNALFEENRPLLGDDWFPYGVEANRATIDTFLRYHFRQGLSKRLLTSDDIFAEELLDT